MSTDSRSAAGCARPAGTSSGFSFPKRYRLTKTDEYSSVFGFRRALKSPHFLLHYRPRAEEEGENWSTARFGVVVPKRLVKAAVLRNLIKRIGREQFRLLRSRLPARDLVLRLNSKLQPLDRKAVAAEIEKLLLKLTAPTR